MLPWQQNFKGNKFLIRFWIMGLFLLPGCSKNAYDKVAPSDSQETAQRQMESGDYEGAQRTLETLLESQPELYSARSLLAASFAAQAGISILQIIQKAASSPTQSSGQTSGQAAGSSFLTAFLPEASLLSIEKMEKAVEEMSKIPSISLTSNMKLQSSLLLTLLPLMRLKYLASNPSILQNLTPEQALELLQKISSDLSQAVAIQGQDSGPLAKSIQQVNQKIGEANGENSKEKLAQAVQKL